MFSDSVVTTKPILIIATKKWELANQYLFYSVV